MGNNIEWARPSGLSSEIVTPEDFLSEDSQFFDAYDEIGEEHYGIVVDSGSHLTLIVGSVESLEAMAEQVTMLAALALEHRTEVRLSNEEGTCDTCGLSYPLSSREGRCGDCGECALHCPHLAQQVINRFVELAPEWVTSWEYPGIFTLQLDDTHELCTALNGWHYATINRLNTEDNSWEPDPDNDSLSIDFECTAPGHNDHPDSCTCTADAATLADAIEAAALTWQEAHRG